MKRKVFKWFLISIIMIVLILTLNVVFVVGAEAAKVTLRFSDWHLAEAHWKKALEEAKVIFEKAHPDIEVILETVSYGEKETKYITASIAETAPDVMHLHAYSLRSFIERGFCLDLTPFIEKEGKDFLKAWYAKPLTLCSYEGKLYAMPGDYMAQVLVRNTEMFKEAGLDPAKPPQTWDEFLECAQALTLDKDGDFKVDQWGFGMIGAKSPGFELRFSPFLWTFGGDYLTPDFKHSALDTPEALEAIKFFVGLYRQYGVVPPGATSCNPFDVRTQMAQKVAAMNIGSGWTVPIVHSINPDLNASQVLEYSSVPMKAEHVTSAWLSAWIISPNTKHPEEAWELVKFITSKEMELKWFRDASVLSSREDVSGVAPEILTDKHAKVVASELAYAKFVPQIKEWPEIIDAVTTEVQNALIGVKTPEKALADAHKRVNEILAR